MFVDSDDQLPRNAIEKMVHTQKEYEADIVMGKSVRNLGRVKKKQKDSVYDNKVINNDEIMRELYVSFLGINIIPVTLWGKLYRKELFDKIKIYNLKHGEDLCWNMQIFPLVQRMISIREVVYQYNYGGMTNKFNDELFEEAILAYQIKYEYLDSFNYERGYVYTDIELVNFLITYLSQYYLYKNATLEKLVELLKINMKDKHIINAINNLKSTKYADNRKFQLLIDGCIYGDEDKLLDWLKEYTIASQKRLIIFNLKRLVNRIISIM